jgi:hypothetical protein
MFACTAVSSVVERASLVIHRSPAAVFRVVGERFFTNYPRWSPEVQEVSPIGSGPIRTGMRARQVRVDLGYWSESIFSVTVFEPGRRICFEGVSTPYRCDYEIKAISPMSSALLSVTFKLPLLESRLKPFESLIREAVGDGVARTVRNVKCLVEAETPVVFPDSTARPRARRGNATVYTLRDIHSAKGVTERCARN